MIAVAQFATGHACTKEHVAQLWHGWQPHMDPTIRLWLVDLSQLQRFDTAGVMLLNALVAEAERHGCEVCFRAPLEMSLPEWALLVINRRLWLDDVAAVAS